MAALDHAKGFIRRQVAQQLRHLRTAPDLRFMLDTSIDHSIRISELLRDNQ
jgi:ribosome-binding factor A